MSVWTVIIRGSVKTFWAYPIYRRDRLMSIHLFFNVITAFVNAEFVALSKFLNACEIEKFWLLLQPLFGRILELIIARKSLSTKVLLQIWKQMVITRCHVRRIWSLDVSVSCDNTILLCASASPVEGCGVFQMRKFWTCFPSLPRAVQCCVRTLSLHGSASASVTEPSSCFAPITCSRYLR